MKILFKLLAVLEIIFWNKYRYMYILLILVAMISSYRFVVYSLKGMIILQVKVVLNNVTLTLLLHHPRPRSRMALITKARKLHQMTELRALIFWRRHRLLRLARQALHLSALRQFHRIRIHQIL